MNQFRLDLDATRCAQAHQDAHCGKMLCELMQQACTAFPEPRSARLRFPDTVDISDHVENVLQVQFADGARRVWPVSALVLQ